MTATKGGRGGSGAAGWGAGIGGCGEGGEGREGRGGARERATARTMLPCTYPTRTHATASAACLSANVRTICRYCSRSGASARTSGNSRSLACATSCFSSSAAPGTPRPARRAHNSRWPTRMKDGAARVVIAQRSTTIWSGGWSCEEGSLSLYHMRRVYLRTLARSMRERCGARRRRVRWWRTGGGCWLAGLAYGAIHLAVSRRGGHRRYRVAWRARACVECGRGSAL